MEVEAADLEVEATDLIEERLEYLKARAQLAVAILEKTARFAQLDKDADAYEEYWLLVRDDLDALWKACDQAVKELQCAYEGLLEALPDAE